MRKTRPCAVVSPDEMNRTLGTVIVVPLTSTLRALPFYLRVNYGDHEAAIACDRIKAIDKRRVGEEFAVMAERDAARLSNILQIMFAR